MIWRRQRMVVDTQIRYYANGLLEDYYRKYRKEEFDTELEDFGEESEWDSEDEWTSEEGAEDAHVADNTNTSSAAEFNQPATSRSIPAGGYNSAPQEMAPPLPARAPPVRISNNQQRPYDHQSYPDSTTHRGAGGYGGHRDVTHHYDEDEEGEEYQGEGEGEGEDEEAQEPEPEDEQGEDYPGEEAVENDEEEQGNNAYNYEGYGAGQMAEEGQDEYDDGYGY